MKPRAFRTAGLFRAWLAKHHGREKELVIRLYKTGAAPKGMTYLQAVEEALCYGWIDGVRHALDDESFTQRFTPRKPDSIWSRINIAKVETLIKAGRMAEPGLKMYRERDPRRAGLYSFEREAMAFSPAIERQFRKAAPAWKFFQAQPPGYRRLLTFWVMSPKQEETRVRRLGRLIGVSAKGKRLL
jgi:uncharacterized protein YdeI (YjbR/CyaY-like superfamily)